MTLQERRELRRKVLSYVRENLDQFTLRDRARIRMALRFAPDLVAEEILNHAEAENIIDPKETKEINWEALADFIIKVLPVIIEAILKFL
ncbi:MAG: hypothetical protein KatS3mg087_1389 [Patescibacteria group bacterium]|nr:MAG: hypothetical protein KatS3mg087_1389 [Patescibacteria group bacterium]